VGPIRYEAGPFANVFFLREKYEQLNHLISGGEW